MSFTVTTRRCEISIWFQRTNKILSWVQFVDFIFAYSVLGFKLCFKEERQHIVSTIVIVWLNILWASLNLLLGSLFISENNEKILPNKKKCVQKVI